MEAGAWYGLNMTRQPIFLERSLERGRQEEQMRQKDLESLSVLGLVCCVKKSELYPTGSVEPLESSRKGNDTATTAF